MNMLHCSSTLFRDRYPQSAATNNPIGRACFDWGGETGPDFDTHDGAQTAFVMAVIGNLTDIVGSVGAGAIMHSQV